MQEKGHRETRERAQLLKLLRRSREREECAEDDYRQLLQVIGDVLADARAERGFKQQDFAACCGLHKTTLCRMEKGARDVNFRNLCLLLSKLDMELDEFFSEVCRVRRALKKLEGK